MKSGKDRVLVALDVSRLDAALDIVSRLEGETGGFKVGLELCTACGVSPVVEAVSERGGKVFLDLKFKDIPNTVAGAVKAACLPGVFMLNVHCDGGKAMMKAARDAADAADHKPLVIGVTVLTSIDQTALTAELGVGRTLEAQVVELAKLAREAGLDGVVCSPKEVGAIKNACGDDFITVVPGVRPAWAQTQDQKRVSTPADTLKAGADYLVVGRPITNPPEEIGGIKDAARHITRELDAALGGQKCK